MEQLLITAADRAVAGAVRCLLVMSIFGICFLQKHSYVVLLAMSHTAGSFATIAFL